MAEGGLFQPDLTALNNHLVRLSSNIFKKTEKQPKIGLTCIKTSQAFW
jgi:hypothetical protein